MCAHFQFTAHVAHSLQYWFSLITPRPGHSFITAKVRYSLFLITAGAQHTQTHAYTHTDPALDLEVDATSDVVNQHV